MEFDLQWLLVALPVAFGLGWMASRFDIRQLRRDHEESPRAYFKGLNLLLNEKQDQAVDAFIEAVQNDPDTAELHFALGNLFRRRGEFERAVRVHEHLLGRADLKAADRHRAQLALAQDFMKAGLFDRAEAAWQALRGTEYDHDAQLALLSLFERSRDWSRAAAISRQIHASGAGSTLAGQASLPARIAHYECELAEALDAQGQSAEAQAALERAQAEAAGAAATPGSTATPRPDILAGQRLHRAGQHAQALAAWDLLRQRHPAAFVLVASDYADSALLSADAAGLQRSRTALAEALQQYPSVELLRALRKLAGQATAALTPDPNGSLQQVLDHLRKQPSLSAAQLLLEIPSAHWNEEAWSLLRQAVSRAARPLQRYRCAACGFEGQHHYWQCPGCLSWDSYPPQQLDTQ